MGKAGRTSPWTATVAVGRVTFLEIVRDKVLYNAILIAALLLGLAYLASRLTYTRPDRIVLDFGFAAMGISLAMIAVLMGAPLLGREFERRTALIVLSKPVSRFEFLVGKVVGLLTVLTVNWAILSAVFVGIYFSVGGQWSSVHGVGLGFVLLLSWMMGSIAVCFSTITTTSLSVVFSIGIYLIGNNVSQIRFMAEKTDVGFLRILFRILSRVIPDLEHFHLGTKITYGLALSWQYVGAAVLYAGVTTAFFTGLAGLLIYRKEL